MLLAAELRPEHVVLRAPAERAADVSHGRQRAARHAHAAAAGWQQAGNHADGGGLARPVVAQQRRHLAPEQRQREAIHRSHRAAQSGGEGEDFAQAAERQRGLRAGRPRLASPLQQRIRLHVLVAGRGGEGLRLLPRAAARPGAGAPAE